METDVGTMDVFLAEGPLLFRSAGAVPVEFVTLEVVAEDATELAVVADVAVGAVTVFLLSGARVALTRVTDVCASRFCAEGEAAGT
jgi:hypothetical protein